MIINHNNKFVYIRTVKTGSSSLEVYLSQFCKEKDTITPLFQEEEKFKKDFGLPSYQNCQFKKKSFGIKNFLNFNFYNTVNLYDHKPIDKISKTDLHHVIKDYFFFSFVRNPFDWITSLFYWKLIYDNKYNISVINDRSQNDLDYMFEKFIEEEGKNFFEWQKKILTSKIYKINIFKYEEIYSVLENLKKELNLVNEKLSLQEINLKKFSIKKRVLIDKNKKKRIIDIGEYFFNNFYFDII